MRLLSLRVKDFRGIDAEEVRFGDGITVVAGRNEAGKTSLVDAFDFLIKHKATSRREEINRAQPYRTEAGPEVEAEFTIGDERVSYRKRWLTKPETVLAFLEGPRAGQTLVADEAHLAADELWGSLDSQLWEASRLMQASALDQSPLSSCSALQRALEAQAGGTIDDGSSGPLMERVTAEADRYYQPKRGDFSRSTKAAVERVTAAEKRLAEAKDALEELSDLVTTLVALEADIDDQQAVLDGQRRDLGGLAAQAESARANQSALEAATRTVETAQRDCDDAKAQLAAREALVVAAENAGSALAELLAAEASAKESLAPLEESVSDTRDTITRLKSELTDVKKSLASARRFEEQSRTKTAVERLQGQLDDCDRLTKEIAELEAGSVPVDGTVLDRVVELEQSIAIAEATANAGAARVRVESLGNPEAILLDGAEQILGPEAFEQAILDELVIEIPGQLRFTVTPDIAAGGSRRDIDRLREERREILADAGVESTSELKEAIRRCEETAAEIVRLKDRRTDRLEGREESVIRDELSRLLASLERGEEAVEGDIDALVARQEQLEVERETAEAVLDSHQREADRLRTRLAETEGQVKNQQTVTTRATEDLTDARSRCSDEDLEKALAESTAALTAAQSDVATAKRLLDESGGAAVLTDYELQVKHVEGLQKMLGDVRHRHGVTLGILDAKNRDGIQSAHDRAEHELQQAVAERDSILARAEAARLLEEVLARHQKETHRRYIEPFRSALRDLGRATYQDPSFDVDVSDQLEVVSRSMGGTTIPFESLSTGAKEQMSILIRLATASLVSPDDAVPILFDDTLGYSDRTRLRRIVDAIGSADGVGQIIIFTANEDRFAGLDSAARVRI